MVRYIKFKDERTIYIEFKKPIIEKDHIILTHDIINTFTNYQVEKFTWLPDNQLLVKINSSNNSSINLNQLELELTRYLKLYV